MIYVLYHKNCMDGKGAAFAAWKKLGDIATYIEVNYGEPVPSLIDAKEIYVLDFSYPKEVLYKMSETAKVVVLDHHKTAQADLTGVEFAIFDMNKSGAQLAWEYFHPGVPAPMSINYIGDRDLWKFKLPDTRDFSAAAFTYVKTFKDLENCADFCVKGKAILDYQQQTIEILLQNSYLVEESFGGTIYKVAKCNSAVLQSETGNALLGKFPEADFAFVYREDKDFIYVSLRSEDSRTDVSVIAKLHGGGGHRNASGMTIKK